MKEEKVIQYLKDCGFWGNNNLYFYTMAPQKTGEFVSVYGLNYIAVKYHIINRNDDGIGIIPFDHAGRCINDLIIFISNSDLKEVYLEDYKFFFVVPGVRAVIKTTENLVVEFEYNAKPTSIGMGKNMYEFVNNYKNNNTL